MTVFEETKPLIKKYKNQPVPTQEISYQSASSERITSTLHKVCNTLQPNYQRDDFNSNSSMVKKLSGRNNIPITYTWNNINVYHNTTDNNLCKRFFKKSVKTNYERHLLRNVSGIAYPGELLVIMGSSGAGKTTLLNVLTFQYKKEVVVSGNIAINGRRVNSNTLASQLAYVQQDDLFIGTLTVEEHLLFQALVRMDKNIPYCQRIQRVNEVISELALTRCRNTVIGIIGRVKGISGGEMKRLSFASEVLSDPPLMFCDEPTSGLDSYMAHQVISVLKNLAAKGKTIVTTLHQPSSELFSMFDKILLIAEGRVAFMGTNEESCRFFKSVGASCPNNYNPADYFIQLLAIVPGKEIACRYYINTLCDKFENSDIGLKILFKIKSISKFQDHIFIDGKYIFSNKLRYKANWIEQFRAVLWRSWISVIKEPILIKVRLLQTAMVSIIVGFIYLNQKLDQDGVMNINGALFIFLTNMTFQNVFAVINVFCSELPIFLREHKNGMYRVDVYFLSKTIAEAPIFIAVPVIFTIIAYPMIGLHSNFEHFLTTTAIVILVTNVSTSFGYFISCISKNISMALSIGPPVIIPFLLFGGFFLNTASIPAYFKWFSYLSWFRYGNEALLINQWTDVETIACTKSNVTCPKSGIMVLEALNFNKDYFWLDICALLLLIIIFRIVALLALISKTLKNNKYIYNYQ